jgi:hypothetical protein
MAPIRAVAQRNARRNCNRVEREIEMDKHNQLELMLAIRRICGRAAAEGKTRMRKATLRKMDAQINQVKRLQSQNMTRPLPL